MIKNLKLLTAAALAALAGCSGCGSVVRSKAGLSVENAWHAHMHQLSAGELLLAARNAPDSETCERQAKLGLVLMHRGPYHAAMSALLSGTSTVDPGLPPRIPPTSTICGGTEP